MKSSGLFLLLISIVGVLSLLSTCGMDACQASVFGLSRVVIDLISFAALVVGGSLVFLSPKMQVQQNDKQTAGGLLIALMVGVVGFGVLCIAVLIVMTVFHLKLS